MNSCPISLVSITQRHAIASWQWERRSKRKHRAEIAAKPTVEKPADHMVVGIDGAFVKAARAKNQRKNFEIVYGRIEASGRARKIFATVRDLDGLARERVRSALRNARRGPATNLTVLSDGEDAMRLMASQWLSGRVEHRLDWFHLRRRFQWLARSIYWAIDYSDPAYEERRSRYEAIFAACDRMSGAMANRVTRDG